MEFVCSYLCLSTGHESYCIKNKHHLLKGYSVMLPKWKLFFLVFYVYFINDHTFKCKARQVGPLIILWSDKFNVPLNDFTRKGPHRF